MESFEFLRESQIFYVSTINDGKPERRPFGAVMEHAGVLYITTAKTKEVYKQMIKVPHIQIVALKPNAREWISINGSAVEEPDLKLKERMLSENPILNKHFSLDDANYALFKITDIAASIFDDKGARSIN